MTTCEQFDKGHSQLSRQEQLIFSVQEQIVERMDIVGVSSDDLALRLGMDSDDMWRICFGDGELDLRTLSDIADALGTRVKVFLD